MSLVCITNCIFETKKKSGVSKQGVGASRAARPASVLLGIDPTSLHWRDEHHSSERYSLIPIQWNNQPSILGIMLILDDSAPRDYVRCQRPVP